MRTLDGDLVASVGLSAPATLKGGDAAFGAGPRGQGLFLNGQQHLDAGDVGKFSYFDDFTVSAWIKPEEPLSGGIASRTSDDAYADGWTFQIEDGHLQVNLVKRWLDDSIRVETESTVVPGRWQHVAMTYDGSRTAKGIVVTIDGQPQSLVVHYDFLNQDFANKEPLRLGSTGSQHPLKGGLADVQIYRRALSVDDLAILAVKENVSAIAALPRSERTSAQALKMRAAFLAIGADATLQAADDRRARAAANLQQFFEKSIPTSMVMVDQRDPRQTTVLLRGAYDHPGETVTAGIPAAPFRCDAKFENRRISQNERIWVATTSNKSVYAKV
ncbi:MAG: hypothetical protein B7Z55_15950 [Planctomycetales bacterium 12-60-4]|nr:MAG: hypothetical protein B7Z55_15950 [Planctomycetales bacterium 12-60-4]